MNYNDDLLILKTYTCSSFYSFHTKLEKYSRIKEEIAKICSGSCANNTQARIGSGDTKAGWVTISPKHENATMSSEYKSMSIQLPISFMVIDIMTRAKCVYVPRPLISCKTYFHWSGGNAGRRYTVWTAPLDKNQRSLSHKTYISSRHVNLQTRKLKSTIVNLS